MNYHLQDRPCVLCNERERECGLPRLYCKKCANDLLKGRSQAGKQTNIVGVGGQAIGGAHNLNHYVKYEQEAEDTIEDLIEESEENVCD